MQIRISLDTNLQFKLTVLIFWGGKFAQKGYYRSRTEKMNTAIEFSILESTFAQVYHVPSVTFLAFFVLHNTITVLMSLFAKVVQAIKFLEISILLDIKKIYFL